MSTVTHHGRETAYRVTDRAAHGTPMLCIHGSGATRALWTGQHALADERPVVTVDLSGHGESDDIDAAPGYEARAAYAADAAAVARETGATILLGASLGGAVALTVALDHDVPLDALVLAGTGARLSVLSDLLSWLDDDFERAIDFLHRPDALFFDAEERTVERSKSMLRETGREVTARDFRTCHRFDVRDRLGELDLPSLAVVGEYDRLTPREYHETLCDGLPDCDLAIIESAAHLAMIERPDAFNDVVRTFFAERGL